jgi:hypothetical protein
VYGPTNKGDAASLPPRTLLRWNGRALSTALARAGYECEIHEISSTGSERRFLAALRNLLSRSAVVPSLYKLGKRFEATVLSAVPRSAKQEAYVVLALARPIQAD